MINDSMVQTVALAGLFNALVWVLIAGYSFYKLALPIYHPFSLMLIYHLLGFVLRPYYIVKNGGSVLWYRIGFSPDMGDILLASLVANIALFSTFLGFVLTTRTEQGRIPLPAPFHFEVGRPVMFFASLLVVAALGLYANYRIFAGAGLESVLAIETQLDAMAGQRLVGISGYVTALAEFLPSVLLLLVMVPRYRKFAIALIVAYVVLRMAAGAQRLSFVVVIVGAVFYFLVATRRRFPSVKMILLLIAFAFAFNIIGGDRYAVRRIFMGTATFGEVITAFQEMRGGEGITNDVAEFDVSTATLGVVTRNEAYTYGTQYLRLLVWPIPRQIWHEKPVYTSIVNLNDFGDFRYLTTGVYADTFMSFSFFSLVGMMLFLGIFFAKIYEILLRTYNVRHMMFFWIALIYAKTILRDGGVTVFYFWIFSMIPIIALSYFGEMRLCRKTPESR